MSKASRDRLREQFADRCAYCRSPLLLFLGSGQIDHIVPRSAGGTEEFENLCLCCWWCNSHKSNKISARDPITTRHVRLFNPQQDRWNDHFGSSGFRVRRCKSLFRIGLEEWIFQGIAPVSNGMTKATPGRRLLQGSGCTVAVGGTNRVAVGGTNRVAVGGTNRVAAPSAQIPLVKLLPSRA